VKCGNGAFMKSPDAARSLARRLVSATRGLGARAAAFITDMSQPLGVSAGNALEVRESVEVLRGQGPADVRELTLELAARMLELAGAARDRAAARTEAERALGSGAAWERFVAMVRAQGGDVSSVERVDRLPRAPVIVEAPAPRAGTIAAIDTFALGELVVTIGGGRRAKEDAIDPRVGLETLRRIGDRVERGEPLARLHLASDDPRAMARAAQCFTIGDRAQKPELILERVN
jgi:thymidine phosphorylase